MRPRRRRESSVGIHVNDAWVGGGRVSERQTKIEPRRTRRIAKGIVDLGDPLRTRRFNALSLSFLRVLSVLCGSPPLAVRVSPPPTHALFKEIRPRHFVRGRPAARAHAGRMSNSASPTRPGAHELLLA